MISQRCRPLARDHNLSTLLKTFVVISLLLSFRSIMDSQSKSSEGIRVAIRMRPLNEREVNSGQEKVFKCQTQYNAVTQIKDGQAVDGGTSYFDKVFDESARNTDVYDYVGKEIVQGVMGGINGTVFACKLSPIYIMKNTLSHFI